MQTYTETLQEEGVSVNTIRIRLGHESLDVTLAYLKAKMLSPRKRKSVPIAAAYRHASMEIIRVAPQ